MVMFSVVHNCAQKYYFQNKINICSHASSHIFHLLGIILRKKFFTAALDTLNFTNFLAIGYNIYVHV